jgi:hypothetical protein
MSEAEPRNDNHEEHAEEQRTADDENDGQTADRPELAAEVHRGHRHRGRVEQRRQHALQDPLGLDVHRREHRQEAGRDTDHDEHERRRDPQARTDERRCGDHHERGHEHDKQFGQAPRLAASCADSRDLRRVPGVMSGPPPRRASHGMRPPTTFRPATGSSREALDVSTSSAREWIARDHVIGQHSADYRRLFGGP